MLDCKAIFEISSKVSIVVDCGQVAPNILRITTTFRYPDGSFIDLFFKEDTESMFDTFVLTDLGETTAYLLELNIRPWKTAKRKQTIARICTTLGVSQDGGELQVRLTQYELGKLPEALIALAQACIRVADLVMGYHLRTVIGFKDDVEEFLDSNGFRYEVDVSLKGQYGNFRTVDFQVEGPRNTSLLHTLSASNAVVGHQIAEDLFAKWYDLRFMKSNRTFITVFDSSTNIFQDPDLRRVAEFSFLAGFPDEQEQLLNMIAA